MNKHYPALNGKKSLLVSIIIGLLLPIATNINAQANTKKLSDEQIAQITSTANKSIAFVENKGQWPAHVLYRADVPGGQMLVTPDGMLIGLFDHSSMAAVSEYDMKVEEIQSGHKPGMKIEDLGPAPGLKGFGWRLNFIGGNKATAQSVAREGQNQDFSNYLTGDASTSADHVHSYNVITYKDVYPGVHVKYYTAKGGNLENDLIVTPGADASRINMQVEGVDELKMDAKGALILPTTLGNMTIASPVSYLVDANGQRTPIQVKYHLTGKNSISFDVPEYDKSQTLVIDPIVMRWATWIASNTSVAAHCHGVDLDAAGNIYVVSRGGNGLVTIGAFQTTYTGVNGAVILWISKYQEPDTPGGRGVCVWQTYLGGTNTTNPYACTVGPDGYLYIDGLTNDNLATTYGTGSPTPGWTQRLTIGNGGQQCFVAKVAPTGAWAEVRDLGTATLNLSPTLFDLRVLPTTGGSFDLIATGYVNQQTGTAADGDVPFPVYPNGTTAATVTSTTSKINGFVMRLSNDLNTLRWSKQFASTGNTNELFSSVSDASGNILVGGHTNGASDISYNSSVQTTLVGTQDGWLMSLDSANGAASWSRYFNSAATKSTGILCMEVNQQKSQLLIGGMTTGLNTANIPTTTYQTTYPGGGQDFFIASLPIAGTSTTWGTYFGGAGTNGSDNMMGLNIDENNDVYILGYTNSKFTPTTIPAANNPIQTVSYDATDYDALFFKLSGSTGDSLLFYTYLGGKSNEEDPTGERGIKFNNCRIYLAITSESNDFPLTRGTIDSVYTPTQGSTYLPLIVSMANPPDLAGNSITSGGNQTIACGQAPQLITASTPAYIIPTIIRDGVGQTNGTAGAYPNGLPTISSYQWQYSTNNGVTWTSIAGATGQNYTPGPINGFIGTYLFRRTINGDYCSLTGDTLAVVTILVTPAYAAPPITTNSPLCAGQTLDLGTTAQPGFAYAWTGPSGFTSVSQDTTIANVSASNVGKYFLTITNTSNGCPSYPDSAEVSITNPLPAPVAGTNSPVCSGDTIDLTAAGAGTTFSWTGPNGFTSSSQNPVIPNASSADAGTYYVTQSTGGSCISPPDSVTVTINVTPAPFVGSNSPICAGTTLNLTAVSNVSGTTYSWTGPNGFTSNLQNPTIQNAGDSAAGTYTVIATYLGCSSAPASTVVSISPAPPAPIAGNNGPVCKGTPLDLTASNIAGATFSWTGPNGFTSNLQNPTITGVSLGDSGWYYVVANISGCISDTGRTYVVVNPTPGEPVASSNSPVCHDSTLVLSVDSIIPGATYQWFGPNGFTSNSADTSILDATSAASGTYVVVATLSGCPSPRGTVSVVVNTTPPPVATSNSPICAGATLNLNASTIPNATYSWTGPNGFTSNLQDPTIPNATVNDTGTYYVVATENGCPSREPGSVTVIITNTTPPVAGNNGPLCSGDTLNLTATTVTGATYSWTGPGGFVSNVQNPTLAGVTTASAGTYSVIANVSGCNSSSPASTTVVVNPVPSITAGNNSPICDSTTLNLTASNFAGATYAWTGPNGFTSNLQNPSITTVSLADSGTYSVIATASGCASDSGTTTYVIINPIPPAPVAASNSPICAGVTLNLTADSIPNASYSWSGPNGFTSTLQNPTIPGATLAATGTYSVVATVSGCSGYTGTVSVLINAIPAPPSVASNSPICAGATLNLNAGTVEGGTYSWTGPNGFTSGSQDTSIANAVVTDSGIYVVNVTVNGCTSAGDSTDVVIYSLPPAPVASSNSPVCSGQTLSLTASSITGASYVWFGPLGFTAGSQDTSIANVSLAAAGTYSVVASVNGCGGDTGTTVVVVGPPPSASFTSNAPQCSGAPVAFTNTSSSGPGITYFWNFGAGATPDTSSQQNPTGIEFSNSGNLPVVLSVNNGICTTSDTQTVQITSSPRAYFVNNGPVCFPPGVIVFTDSSTGTITSWNWNFGAGATPATSTSQGPNTVTYASSGVQTITLVVANGNCADTTTETADVGVVGADFTSSVPENGDNGCLGQPVNFYEIGNQGTNAQSFWNFGEGAIPATSTADNPTNILYDTTGAKIVTHIVYYTGGGCTLADTIQHIITINPIPTTSFTSTAPVCANTPVNFINTGSSGVNYTYFWDFGSGASPSTSTAENPGGVVYSTSGVKTVTFTITNGFYCSVQYVQNITINSTPVASFSTSAPQCTTLPVDFTNTGTTSGVNWVWNFGSGATPAGDSIQNPTGITYSSAGISVVTLTTTDTASGCSAMATSSVTINQTPTASFTTNAPQCSTSGFNFTNTGSTGGVWAYVWNFGQGANPAISSAENPAGVVYNAGGTKTVTFTITGQGGCTQTSTQAVVVDSTPVASFTSTAPQCTGIGVDFTSTGTSNGVTYSWNFGTGATPATSNSQNPTGVTYSSSGSKTITLVVTNILTGCSDSTSGTINISQSPTVSFTSNAPQCSNVPINFVNTGSTGGSWSYAWSFGQGATPTGSSAENPTGIVYSSGGTKTVSLTVSGPGCTQTATQSIVINSTPVASFVTNAPQCTGLPVNFSNTGTSTGVNWAWSFGSGATPDTSNLQSPDSIIYTNSGFASATLTVTDTGSGCSATATRTFNINQTPAALFTSTAPQCANTGINFTDIGSTGSNWSYSWDFGQGAIPAFSAAQNPAGVIYTTSGTKTVTFSVVDKFCNQTSTQTIVINPTPAVSFVSTAPQCTGLGVDFANTGTTTGVTFAWDFGTGAAPATDTTASPSGVVYSTPGNKTVTLTETDTGSGCSATATDHIAIHLTPTASFTSSAPQCSNVPVNFTNTGSTGSPWSFSWDFGQGANPDLSLAENPTGVTYSSSGAKIVTLTVFDQNCTQTVTDTIMINSTPTATFSSTAPQCTGLGVDFNSAGTSSNVSWIWNFGSGSNPASDSLQNPTGIIYTTAGNKTVTLTITDSTSGCSTTASNTLVIHQTPTASFTSNAPQCSTVPINITNTGSTGSNWFYSWNLGENANPAVSAAENPTGVLYSSSGAKVITFTISDQNCTQTTVDTIVINPTPSASFTSTAPQCTGLPVNFGNTGTSNGVTWLWNFGLGATPSTDTAQNPTGIIFNASGTQTVTLTTTDTGSGCSVTVAAAVEIHQTPTATFTSNAPQCSGVAIDFSNTGSTGGSWSYNWNFGSGSSPATSTGENPTGIVYSSSGSKVITFTVSGGGCTQTSVDTINILAAPMASFTSNAPKCTGLPVDFVNTGTSAGVTWAWNFGTGATPPTATTQYPTGIIYSSAGIIDVTLTISDTASACSATITSPINIYQTPTATFTSNAPQCTNTPVNFTNTGSTGGNWVYAWDFGQNSSPSVSSSQNPNGVLYDSSGAKLVTFTISDANCAQTITDTIVVNNTPLASFTSTAPQCSGLPVSFTNTGTSSGVTWSWNLGTGATPGTSSQQNPTGVTYAIAGITPVTLTITDTASACAAIATGTINIYQTPTATFTSTAPQCTNSPVNFTNTGSTGSNWSFAWDFGQNATPAVSSSENNNGVLYDSSGAKIVTFTISDANCSQSVTDTIQIDNTPVASFTSTAPVCTGLPVNFTNTGSSTGVTWAWNLGTGASPAASVTQNPAGVIYDSSGIITVTLVVTDASTSCSTTASNTINIYQTPTATFTSTAPQCANVPINFNNTGSTGSQWTYAWDFGSNAAPAVSSSENPFGILYDSSGAKTVTFNISDANCSQSTTQVINISPLPIAEAGADTTICANISVKLGGNSVTTGATYVWFPSSTLDNPYVPNPIASPTASITTYSVTVTAPGTGCVNTAYVVVTMLNPLIANAGTSAQICLNDSVGIGAGLIEGQYYHWTPATGLSSTTIPNPVASPTQTTTYTLSVTDTAGCAAVTDNVTVTVNPLPSANAGKDDTIAIGGSVQLTGTGGVQYAWSPAAGLNNADLFNPIASPDSSTIYILTVTNVFGCQSTDTMEVYVFDYATPYFIPSAFTPNGDGHNDVLFVRGGGFLTFEFQVFNRYGQQMFDSKDINEGWDGNTPNGQPAPLDAYVYKLNGVLNDGRTIDVKGLVNLVR